MSKEESIAIRMQDLSPQYAEIMVLGNVLHKSGYFTDVRDQAQAVTKILYGKELGFSPIVSMGGIHIIEGKPALSSNLMATLIKRSGRYDYRIKHRYPHPEKEGCPKLDCLMWNDKECFLTFWQKTDGLWDYVGDASFTMDDAKTAQVRFTGTRGDSGWKKFPKAMLFARALSQGLRAYCPDVSAAPLYNPEEMGAEVNEDGDVTELPKSARPIEVTEKPVTFTKKSVPAKEGNGAEQPKAAVATPAAAPIEDNKKQSLPSTEVPPEDSCIDQKQIAQLNKRFRESLRFELRGQAEKLLHDFVGHKLYLDADGNPSLHMIPKEEYARLGKQAVAFAESL